ncbi:MAG: hypothetical protein AAB066_01755, partial [Candidatus Margulisiibacteriota bacterium]
SLSMLGAHFPQYLSAHYKDKNRDQVIDAAALEWAQNQAWITPNQRPFDPALLSAEQQEGLAQLRWTLQPSLTLLSKPACLVVFQQNLLPETQEVEPAFFVVLSALKAGASLSEALDALLLAYPDTDAGQLSAVIQDGFAFCVRNGLLVHPI